MTQLVPVRWLVLAGLCGYKLQTPGLELEMEMLHRCLETGDWCYLARTLDTS